MNFLSLAKLRFLGNSGAAIPVVVTAPAPAPPPVPAGTLPGYILLADIPAKPPTAGGTATVTPATFANALAADHGSSPVTLYCAGGDYGGYFRINRNNTAMVTFAAADPANPPYMSTAQTDNNGDIQFEGANNITFDGWEFRSTSLTNEANLSVVGANITKINFCSNMRFTRCKFVGGLGSTTGCGMGRGINVVGSTNIQLDRNTFQSVAYGYNIQSYTGTKCVNVYIGYNDFDGIKGIDFIDLYGVYKIVVEWNKLWDVRWIKDDLHTDTVQGGSMYDGVGSGGVEHMVQRNNIIGCTVAGTYLNGTNATGGTHNYPQFSWLTHEPYQGVFNYIAIVDNELYGPSNQAIANNGAGSHYYVARNQIYASNRTDYQIGNAGNPINPVIRATGDRGQSFDDVYIHDNILPGGNTFVNVGNGIDGSGAYTNTVTNVDVGNNTAPASQLSDAQFLTAKSAWETCRAAYY